MAEYLIAFGSTHAALSFEAVFGEEGSLVPIPPTVRAGCGMGLRFFAPANEDACAKAYTIAQELNVSAQIDGIFLKEGGVYLPVGSA